MHLDDPHSPTFSAPPRATSNWVVTFADLVCLLLALFVMLVSMSELNETRIKAAVYSVGKVFALGPGGDTDPYVGNDGDLLAARAVQKELNDVFAAVIPAARVEVVRPGRLLRAAFPAEQLFAADTPALDRNRAHLLDRLAAAVQNPPPGRRLEIEAMVGTAPADGLPLPARQTLESARAGALARAFVARGLDPRQVMAGLEAGQPGTVALLFRLLPAPEGAR